jgi:PKD repeat protein
MARFFGGLIHQCFTTGEINMSSSGQWVLVPCIDIEGHPSMCWVWIGPFPGTGPQPPPSGTGPIPGEDVPPSPAPPPPPIPRFTFMVGSGLSARFINTSLQATSYHWSFGDGSPIATLANPVHAFPATGTYTVLLRAYNSAGVFVDQAQTVVVTSISPKADFSTSAAALKIFFYDESTVFGSVWQWSFGDGSTSTLQNPIHTYDADGTYSVTLTVGGFSITKSLVASSSSGPTFAQSWGSTPNPSAVAADANHVYVGLPTGYIQVWDKSTPPNLITSFLTESATSWAIRQIFSDGSRIYVAMHANISSSLHNQIIIFNALTFAYVTTMDLTSLMPEGIGGVAVDGTYIYATDESNHVYRFNKITFAQDIGFTCNYGSYNIAFDAQYLYVPIFNQVLISNISDGSLAYTLIDGTHLSGIAGIAVDDTYIYVVNNAGNNIIVYDKIAYAYIQTIPSPPTLSDPNGAAVYNSILYVCDTSHQAIQSWSLGYGGAGNAPTAAFSISATSGPSPLTLNFTNASTGDAASMTFFWEFGTGDTSTDTNPSFTWHTPGLYSVRLTATNIFGSSSIAQIILVTSGASFPAHAYIFPVIGDVYIGGVKISLYAVDHDNNRILLYDVNNTVVATFGIAGVGNGQFNAPTTGCQLGGVDIKKVLELT